MVPDTMPAPASRVAARRVDGHRGPDAHGDRDGRARALPVLPLPQNGAGGRGALRAVQLPRGPRHTPVATQVRKRGLVPHYLRGREIGGVGPPGLTPPDHRAVSLRSRVMGGTPLQPTV
eukprot:1193562-Prorocentrum_minimum.AAC.3